MPVSQLRYLVRYVLSRLVIPEKKFCALITVALSYCVILSEIWEGHASCFLVFFFFFFLRIAFAILGLMDLKNRLVVAEGGWEGVGWTGSLRLEDANYCIWRG